MVASPGHPEFNVGGKMLKILCTIPIDFCIRF